MKEKKFLLIGLLSLCLFFAGCSGIGDNSSGSVGNLPPVSESTEESSSSDGDSSSEDSSSEDSSSEDSSSEDSSSGDSSGKNDDSSSDNNQNENPYAGGLENGGEFEGN